MIFGGLRESLVAGSDSLLVVDGGGPNCAHLIFGVTRHPKIGVSGARPIFKKLWRPTQRGYGRETAAK